MFKPIQPNINSPDECYYRELRPDIRLVKYICCYWRLHSTAPLTSSFNYRVIPDGCIDIFFDMNNVNDASIMGFSTSSNVFELGRRFDYAGIRFMPSALP